MAPLTLETEVLREGRKIQLCAVRLRAGDAVVVGATVLKIKTQALTLPPEVAELPRRTSRARSGARGAADFSSSPFVTGMSMRAARGRFGVPGPGAIWYRVDRPLVEGAAISQAMRAVVAADFCNAPRLCWISGNGPFSMPTSPSVSRGLPVGDWILLDAESWIGPDGAGLAMARLADQQRLFRPRRPEPRHREALDRAVRPCPRKNVPFPTEPYDAVKGLAPVRGSYELS